MNLPRGIAEKYLIFETQALQFADKNKRILHSADDVWLWSDRLILINDEDYKNYAFHNFIAIDLLTNEQSPIRFRKPNELYRFNTLHPLNNNFSFIIEHVFEFFWRVNFVKLNWDKNEFELIEKIELKCQYIWIYVEKLNPSNLVLQPVRDVNDNTFNYQIYKFENDKIKFVETHESDTVFHFYHDDKLINISFIGWFQFTIYDFVSKKENIVELDGSLLPENVYITDYISEWVKDRLYAKIRYEDTENYGIAWVDLTEKRWKLLEDFKTDLEIDKLEFLNGNLIVNTKNVGQNKKIFERKIYGIQMRRPNYLRYSAWICVVKVMKNRGEENPYKAAKEYLPLNSDLRELWFKDEEKETKEK